jgi:hypothetical protein
MAIFPTLIPQSQSFPWLIFPWLDTLVIHLAGPANKTARAGTCKAQVTETRKGTNLLETLSDDHLSPSSEFRDEFLNTPVGA